MATLATAALRLDIKNMTLIFNKYQNISTARLQNIQFVNTTHVNLII